MAKPAIDLTSLTDEEKLELIDDLWRSLSPDNTMLTPELRAELDRRLDRVEREGATGTDWDDVLAEMAPLAP